MKPCMRTVNIDVCLHPQETMFLRQHVGTAKDGDREFEMSANMGGYSPIVRLPDGRWVSFSWSDLVAAADRAGKQGVGAVLSEKRRRA